MMGSSILFPSVDRPTLGLRLNQWVSRWNHGGIEHYSLSSAGAAHDVPLAWSLEGGIEVTQQRIWVHRLPEAFRGFRIVQLSDIHHGLFVPLYTVIEAVELANQLEPDLVVLTGDFVTYSRAYVEPTAAMLGHLRARYGVFAVLGNHDFRVGGDQVACALRRERIEVLRNRHTAVRRRGQALYVAGIDDFGYGADLPRALRGIPPGAPIVLLAHNPRIIRPAARNGVSLVLAGHTHGGQVNLPLVGTIYGRSPEGMRFKIGWDRLGPTQIYVSRGIGTVVLPVRVRCPAEIPHFELQPHDADRAPNRDERSRTKEDAERRSTISCFVTPAD
jgi:predicted MPP superfamily phosphohydrolase